MSSPFLSEIKIVSFNFPPKGWAFCNGQLLPISQNTALFALLGTTYGGNGSTTFALPNLQGCIPLHIGSGFTLGQTGGEQTHTLTLAELAGHVHPANCNASPGTEASPDGSFWAHNSDRERVYSSAENGAMAPDALTMTGGGGPHQNLAPYLVLNFIIALQGIFPTQD